MTRRKYRRRVFIAYLMIIVTFGIYVVGKTHLYQLKLDQKNLIAEINESQILLEEANVRINTLISRESISNDYPELKLYSDNVYYLENVDDGE